MTSSLDALPFESLVHGLLDSKWNGIGFVRSRIAAHAGQGFDEIAR
jgi:hypothetical protein